MSERKKLGEILHETTGLSPGSLAQALSQQAEDPKRQLGELLVELGAVNEEDIAAALAEQLELIYVDPTVVEVDPSIAWKMNRNVAERMQCIPIRKELDGTVLVAMAHPEDHETRRDLEFAIRGRVSTAVASPTRIQQAITRHFSVESVANRLLSGVKPELRTLTVTPNYLELDAGKIQSHIERGGSNAFVDLVDFLLINAIERGASDIHLEPQKDGVRIRLRIDGLLREALTLPQWALSQTVGRIKVIGNMDVAEKRKPQDGKATAGMGGREIELRIATLPSQYGESVTIRVLDPKMIRTSLSDLGWPRDTLKSWYRLLSQPRGMLLVVGPTGSGKSTTLYASIHRLNSGSTSTVTIEDPIEYTLPGITQVQVNTKAGITFAASVKAMLRQDPNVIVIGEIRDPETAAAAIDAAQTGHLVLSTLHTSNAVAAVTRLLDLDVPGYLLGGALAGVVAQRLVRKVCSDCSIPANPVQEDWERIGLPPIDLGPDARRAGPGCPTCQYMGYEGRIGVFELLPFSSEMGQLVQSGADEHQLWARAREDGMRTVYEDAIHKVREGKTTLEELARVVPVGDYPRAVMAGTIRALKSTGQASPVTPAEPDPTELPTPPKPERVVAANPAPPKGGPALKIGRPVALIVDDADEILELVGLTLEDDYDIRTASDGVEAMASVAQQRPDLIVLDVMMPRKTGYEVCNELKDDPETSGIPILMLSARGETAHVKKGFYAGADDYLPKPFDPEELLLRSRALLRRSGWSL